MATKHPSHAYFEGGPCNGLTVALTDAEYAAGDTSVCQGIVYRRTDPPKLHSGALIYKSTGKQQPGTATQPKAAHLHHGWADLRRSINHNMPAALRRSHKSLSAGLRHVERASRVKLK